MPDEIEPTQPPSNPANLAELLPFLPVSYDYGKQWALVFSEELADRLAAVQAENPQQFVAKPVQLTDGRHMLCGDILSETAGLYRVGFAKLDAGRFNEISIMPLADALALLPQPEPEPV